MSTPAKTALITGAARGLGLHIAEQLGARGLRIVGLDLRAELLEAAMAKLAATGVESLGIVADIGREADVRAAVEQALARFGGIDVLVHNAGYREVGKLWTLSTETWDRTLDTNLKGPFLLTRELLTRDMLARDAGRIIFISSDAGKHGSEDSSIYCASKWGVLGFAAALAKDLKHTGVRVTSILPGMIETPMARESEVWDKGYVWLDPAHVARAVVYCAEQPSNVHIPELEIHDRAHI